MRPVDLNRRERQVLNALAALGREYPGQPIAREAVAHIAGECAGSLAALAMGGYAIQRVDNAGHVVYELTDRGWAKSGEATRVGIVVPRVT